MRIHVLGDESIGAQALSYAEYRLFATLSQVVDMDRVRDARVVLHGAPAGHGVSCSVSVALADGDELRVRTTADHPYAAINDAVDRLRTPRRIPRAGAPTARLTQGPVG